MFVPRIIRLWRAVLERKIPFMHLWHEGDSRRQCATAPGFSGDDMRLDRNFANGCFIDAASDELIAVINPATEAVIGHVTGATRAEAIAAVDAAAAAQNGWRKLPSAERAGYLH